MNKRTISYGKQDPGEQAKDPLVQARTEAAVRAAEDAPGHAAQDRHAGEPVSSVTVKHATET